MEENWLFTHLNYMGEWSIFIHLCRFLYALYIVFSVKITHALVHFDIRDHSGCLNVEYLLLQIKVQLFAKNIQKKINEWIFLPKFEEFFRDNEIFKNCTKHFCSTLSNIRKLLVCCFAEHYRFKIQDFSSNLRENK